MYPLGINTTLLFYGTSSREIFVQPSLGYQGTFKKKTVVNTAGTLTLPGGFRVITSFPTKALSTLTQDATI